MENIIPKLVFDVISFTEQYGVNANILLWVYLLSIFPVYLGIFILYYSRSWRYGQAGYKIGVLLDIFSREKLTVWGLVILVFGIIMPYAYVFFASEKVSPWLRGFIILLAIFSAWLSTKRYFRPKKLSSAEAPVVRLGEGIDLVTIDQLWLLYSGAFSSSNQMAPCQQSISRKKDFIEELQKPTVYKYVIAKDGRVLGLGLMTNNLDNCTWVSKAFFEQNYSRYVSSGQLYYFMGVAVDKAARGRGLGRSVVAAMLGDLPRGSVLAFDHSIRVNPFIPQLYRAYKGRGRIVRRLLDKQVYYAYSIK